MSLDHYRRAKTLIYPITHKVLKVSTPDLEILAHHDKVQSKDKIYYDILVDVSKFLVGKH